MSLEAKGKYNIQSMRPTSCDRTFDKEKGSNDAASNHQGVLEDLMQ